MESELIYESESCKAVYIENNNRIFFEFKGYLKLDDAIEMYTKVLAFMRTNRVVSFLNDLTELQGSFTNLTRWIFENMKEIVSLGLKYDALVMNDDIFSQFAAEDFSKKVSAFEFMLFPKMSEAEKWLEERGA